MAVYKILLPYNFSPMDQKALDFIIRTYQGRKDVEMTLFHSYTPIPEIDTDSSTVMVRLSSSMQFLSQQLKEKEEKLESRRAYLSRSGFADNCVDYIFRPRGRPVADEIIHTVKQGGYDVVVLSCRAYRITRVFIQSVHEKVISSLKDTAICIVT